MKPLRSDVPGLFCFVGLLNNLVGLVPKAAAPTPSTYPMKLQMLKPRLSVHKATRLAPAQPVQRVVGNSLYALMKRFERDNPRVCAECVRQGTASFGAELDHIHPLHLGGTNSLSNMQWLCKTHHAEKTEREAKARAGGG